MRLYSTTGSEGAGRLDASGQSGETVLLHLADQVDVDVGQDTSSGDGGLDELIKLIVGADSEQQVAGVDTLYVHVLGGVSGQLKQLGGEVFEDGSRVDGSSGSDTASGVRALLQETVDASDGELYIAKFKNK